MSICYLHGKSVGLVYNELTTGYNYIGNIATHPPSGNNMTDTTAPVDTTISATTAVVTKVGDKYACHLGAVSLGTSKHQDYFEYHLRKGDVKALREAGITAIAYTDDTGDVTRFYDPAVAPTKKASATPAADDTKAATVTPADVTVPADPAAIAAAANVTPADVAVPADSTGAAAAVVTPADAA